MAKGKLWIILLIAAILLAASVVVYMKKTQPLEDLTQQYENIIRLTHSQDNYRTVWSSDGSKLAFGWTPNLVGYRSDIYLIDVLATMKR
jgi:ABC-type glycerol-3-phosphate transport system permease component